MTHKMTLSSADCRDLIRVVNHDLDLTFPGSEFQPIKKQLAVMGPQTSGRLGNNRESSQSSRPTLVNIAAILTTPILPSQRLYRGIIWV